MMKKLLFLMCSALMIAAVGEDDGSLEALRKLSLENGGVVESVEFTRESVMKRGQREFKDLSPRTMVKIRFKPEEGSNINVEVWLPERERWNRRFIGLGNGGAAGGIDPNGFSGLVRGGYAAANTDMGTSPNANSGVGNPAVWKDFGYRATHLMTVAAKRVIETYYGQAPELSYFHGNSTGGQQALQEAQRYPEDYDGIVATVPAHCRTPLHAYFLWNWQILRKCPFSPEQEQSVITAANEHMAGREPPQMAGKAISDPRVAEADIEAVIALARQKDASLTDQHAQALRKIFAGPRHAVTGEVIFGGVPLGSSFRAATGHLYLFNWVFGNKKYEDINFGDDIDTYTAKLGPYLNAENPDLRAFAKRGGKLLILSASADSIVPYHATLDYYERMVDVFGSPEAVRAFCRFYIVPGRDHGARWTGVNVLPSQSEMMINWRENGIAPEGFAGKRFDNGVMTWQVPILPYPAQSVYDAKGRTFSAVDGPRGGVIRVAERFSPPAKE